MEDARLIAVAAVGIVTLLILIIRVRLHAFVALLLVSVLLGIAAGMPLAKVLKSVESGMAGTLGTIAVLVGLGAMFGQMLEASGGAETIAQALLERLGLRNAQWSLVFTGFFVGIPVFFDVAFIILVPVVYGLTEKTSRPVVYFALPLLAGLAVTHAFIPPTPGPIAVASLMQADIGWVILFGALAGIPAAVVAGPLLARMVARRIRQGVPSYMAVEPRDPERALPPVSTVALLIATPLILIVGNTLAKALLAESNPARRWLMFLGHPMVALLATTILCFVLLGTRRGFARHEIQEIASKALEPAGVIILVTGGGGVLKQMLVDSGVGDVLSQMLQASSLPPILLAFLVAALLRVMQGSATVAMLGAAGLVSSLLGSIDLSQPGRALAVVAIAAGATTGSHVNDSGFWLVNRYLGLSVGDTLRTWTVATTAIGLAGLAAALFMGLWVG